MNKNLRKSNILIALVLNAVLLVVGIIIFTPTFETNDDTFNSFMAAGYNTGNPSELIVLIHYTFGFIFKFLFSLPINLNWYTVFQILVLYASASMLTYYLLKYTKRRSVGIALGVLLFFIFYYRMYLNIQYTATGFIAAFTGMLIMFEVAYKRTGLDKNAFYKLLIAIIFIIIATGIRASIIKGAIMMAFPFFALYFLRNRNWLIPIFFVITVSIYFTLDFTHRTYYNNNGHPDALKYCHYQSDILNFPVKPTEEALNSVNWSRNDFDFMNSCWFFIDSTKYSTSSLQTFSENALYKRSVTNTVKKSIEVLNLSKRNCIAALVILLFLFLAGNKWHRIYALLLSATFLGIVLFLSQTMHTPKRVLIPLLFFVVIQTAMLLLLEYKKFSIPGNKIVHWGLGILAVLALAYQFYAIGKIVERNNMVTNNYNLASEDFKSLRDNSILVVPGGSFPFEGVPVFTHPQKLAVNRLIYTSWLIEMPEYKATLKTYNIDNLIEALYERNDLILTHPCSPELEIFIEENYDVEVEAVPVEGEFKYLSPFQLIKCEFDSTSVIPTSIL
ncbi:MAG: hypothetical protein MI922_13885 [Bacteroidales bacterium]|nr:hypothetical protein [Bacteroidales bacterium]